jgi:hypothetical protein
MTLTSGNFKGQPVFSLGQAARFEVMVDNLSNVIT